MGSVWLVGAAQQKKRSKIQFVYSILVFRGSVRWTHVQHHIITITSALTMRVFGEDFIRIVVVYFLCCRYIWNSHSLSLYSFTYNEHLQASWMEIATYHSELVFPVQTHNTNTHDSNAQLESNHLRALICCCTKRIKLIVTDFLAHFTTRLSSKPYFPE